MNMLPLFLDVQTPTKRDAVVLMSSHETRRWPFSVYQTIYDGGSSIHQNHQDHWISCQIIYQLMDVVISRSVTYLLAPFWPLTCLLGVFFEDVGADGKEGDIDSCNGSR